MQTGQKRKGRRSASLLEFIGLLRNNRAYNIGMKIRKAWFLKWINACKLALPFVLALAVILCVAFFPQPERADARAKRVVRIWNVDTFEGGKGSRTSFLKKIARRVEKQNTGVYYMISGYTAEGANAAASAGEAPDALSFGVGLSAFAEQSLPLPKNFAGGEAAGSCLAYPWCRGEYALFSLTDNFTDSGAAAISTGGSNLPQVSAALSGVTGEEVESLSAYVCFLNGEYRYLLGTQRDTCRFASRGTAVYKKTLSEYNDLYQYFSILSAEKREDCLLFFNELLSDRAQEELSGIGMLPVKGDPSVWTASVFSDASALAELAALAKSADGLKNPQKFLKNI